MRSPRIGSRSALVIFILLLTGVNARAQTPDDMPFVITLETDRGSYLPLEPIRVRVWLEPRASSYAIEAHGDETIVAIDVTRSAPSSIPRRVQSWSLPEHGGAVTPSGDGIRLDLFRGRPLRWSAWYVDQLPAGVTTLRARALIMVGPDAGSAMYSDYVPVVIREPHGADRDAYEFMTGGASIEIDGVTRHGGYRTWGLWHEGADRSDLPKYEHFIARHDDSRYADYVRSTVGRLLGPARDRTIEHWTALIDRLPPDSPLLAGAYVQALAYHRARLDWPAMRELLDRYPSSSAATPEPDEAMTIAMWNDALTPWPPRSASARARLATSRDARALAARARAHWLTQAIDERLARGRSTRIRTHAVEVRYLDTPSGVPLRVWFRDDAGATEHVEIEGAVADLHLALPVRAAGLPAVADSDADPVIARGVVRGDALALEYRPADGDAWIAVDGRFDVTQVPEREDGAPH